MELLAYILTRRSPEGALQSLTAASMRDDVHLSNLRAPPAKQTGQESDINSYLSGGG